MSGKKEHRGAFQIAVIAACILIALCYTLIISTACSESEASILNSDSELGWNVKEKPTPIDETLLWTKIGAIGSCAGAIISVSAIVISILAFRVQLKTKLGVTITSSFGIGVNLNEKTELYAITVNNYGVRPTVIHDILLRFGKNGQDIVLLRDSKYSIIFNQSSSYPCRIESGDSVQLFLSKERLDKAINYYESKSPNALLYIVVDEATTGKRLFRTNLYSKDFCQTGT